MPRKQFEANVRHRPGGVAMIDLNGEIDGFAKETLTTAYDEAEKGDPEVVLLDFGGVGYINSAGIALIVDLLARARASTSGASWPAASRSTTWRSSRSPASRISWLSSKTKRAQWRIGIRLQASGISKT